MSPPLGLFVAVFVDFFFAVMHHFKLELDEKQ